MKNLFTMSLLALCLTGIGFAQQEVSPDRFEGDSAKQPVKVKHAAKSSQSSMHVAQAKHRASNKSGNRTVLAARTVSGN